VWFSGDAAKVAKIAAAVDFRVAVERFLPEPAFGQTNSILVPRHGCEVQDHQDAAAPITILTNKGHHAVLVVRTVHPEKAVVIEVPHPKARRRFVELV